MRGCKLGEAGGGGCGYGGSVRLVTVQTDSQLSAACLATLWYLVLPNI